MKFLKTNLFFVLTSLILSSCGNNNQNNRGIVPLDGSVVVPGGINTNITPGSISVQTCSQLGGIQVDQYCVRTILAPGTYYWDGQVFPRIHAYNIFGGINSPTSFGGGFGGIQNGVSANQFLPSRRVYPGDQIIFNAVNGAHGSYSVSRHQFGPLVLQTIQQQCAQYGISGINRSNQQREFYQGLPKGLIASDGNGYAFLLNDADSFIVDRETTLYFGFNTQDTGYNCGYVGISDFKVITRLTTN